MRGRFVMSRPFLYVKLDIDKDFLRENVANKVKFLLIFHYKSARIDGLSVY